MHGILAHTGSCAVWKRIEARTRGRILRSLLDARPSASSFAWLGRVSRYNDPRPRLKSTKLAAYKGRRFRGVRVRAPSHRTPSISVFSLSLSLSFFLFSLFSSISFLPPRSSSFFFFPSLSLSDCLSRFFCSIPSSEASRFLFLLFSLSSLSSSFSIFRFYRPFRSVPWNYKLCNERFYRRGMSSSRITNHASRHRPLGLLGVEGFEWGRKRERDREGSGAATVGLGKNE